MPLYGDMMIGPFQYIQRTPNYSADKWPSCNSHKESAQANLLRHPPVVRAEYVALMSELALSGSHKVMYERALKTEVKAESRAMDDAAYYALALRTLRTLSSWTSRITELVSIHGSGTCIRTSVPVSVLVLVHVHVRLCVVLVEAAAPDHACAGGSGRLREGDQVQLQRGRGFAPAKQARAGTASRHLGRAHPPGDGVRG